MGTSEHIDKDLLSVQQARDLALAAKAAVGEFKLASQDKVDAICQAIVTAAMDNAERLAQMAHEETGFGIVAHKKLKNELAAQGVWDHIKDEPTCGIVGRDDAKRIIEIGAPVGVVLGLSPSTNPTSTAIFKVLIGVKARNAVIITPHPSAQHCTAEAVRVIQEAAERAGAPKGLISCLTRVEMAGTNELLSHHAVNLILATGGPGMVKAAHSTGKPAIGVGPGNVPAYVDRSADVQQAAEMIVNSKSFDLSTICASEQLVVADQPIAADLKRAMQALGAHWLTRDEADILANTMFRPNGLMDARYVAKTPQVIGQLAGIAVPEAARVLMADIDDIGPDHPLSREKLTTVLGWKEVADWREGCEVSLKTLKFGGDGHSLVMHCQNEDIVMAFGIEKPAFRILVNTWSTLGATGATTALAPSFTLGPGGVGGSIVSENISVKHLLNTRRIAYPVRNPPASAYGHAIPMSAPAMRATHGSVPSVDVAVIESLVQQVLKEMRR